MLKNYLHFILYVTLSLITTVLTNIFKKVLLPYLLASCESSDGIICVNDDESFNIIPEEALETAAVNQRISIKVLASFMDEKSAAASCLGWLISENPEAAASYIEASFNVLANLTRFDLYTPVASSAITGVVQIISGLLRLLDEDFMWQKGKVTQLPDAVISAIQGMYGEFSAAMELTEQAIVTSIIQASGKMALLFGPAGVMDYLGQIIDWISKVLCRQTNYQMNRESFDENEEDFDTFNIVMDSIVDLSKACGSLIVSFLPNLLNCFAPYIQEGVPEEYLECTLSALAELADEIEYEFQPFASAFIPACLRSLRVDFEGFQYVCLCLRKIVQFGQISPDNLLEIWAPVNHIMQKPPTTLAEYCVFDCLFGLICRILLQFPDAGLPIDQIVNTMADYLPLRTNPEPAKVIYTCITHFANRPGIASSLPKLKHLFIKELQEGDITDETKVLLHNFIQV